MLILSNAAEATSSKREIVSVSPTAQFNLPFEAISKAHFPSFNTQYLKVKLEDSSFDVYVIHNRPKTLANSFSVERYWNESRNQTESNNQSEENFGCHRLNSGTHRCARNVGQNGKFVSESLYWIGKTDLVLVRAASFTSFKKTKSVVDQIKLSSGGRLPAESQE